MKKYLPIILLLLASACTDSCDCGHEPSSDAGAHDSGSPDQDAGSDQDAGDTDGGK